MEWKEHPHGQVGRRPLVHPVLLQGVRPMSTKTHKISLIGAPTDVGAGHRGALMGPDALRIAGFAEALGRRGVDVEDRGNLDGPRNPWTGPVDGYRHLQEVVDWNRAVFDAVASELAGGRMPVLMGGAPCQAVGTTGAVASHGRATGRKLRIIWLDAHADFITHEVTPSGNIHGMPVSCLCGLGPEELTTLSGPAPAIKPGEIRQIGIRSVDKGEKRLVKEYGLDGYDMRYIDEHRK